jgi:hypothetical protein
MNPHCSQASTSVAVSTGFERRRKLEISVMASSLDHRKDKSYSDRMACPLAAVSGYVETQMEAGLQWSSIGAARCCGHGVAEHSEIGKAETQIEHWFPLLAGS